MAIRTDALAQVYARSLFELAEEAGGREKIIEVGDELEQICETARGDRAFREFLGSPIVNRRARGATIAQIFRDRITDLTLRFLLVLNEKGRLGHLEPINAAYDQLVQEAYGRIEVDVFTPAPLGDQQLHLIAERIRAALGKDPVLHRYTDRSMIGGLKLRVGDQLIDGSVSTRLRKLRQSLMTTGPSAVRARIERIIEEGGDT
jgi:F-type H+-transporting ATPase subunit delta